VYAAQIERRESGTLPTNGLHPHCFLAEAITRFINIKCYHRANIHSKYADGLYTSPIKDKDGHIPSPVMIFTCYALCHALLKWQKNKDIQRKASKSKLIAERPDPSNNFN